MINRGNSQELEHALDQRAILDKLTSAALSLYPNLPYHNKQHATDVWRNVVEISRSIPDTTRLRLPSGIVMKQAAVWHDSGYNHKTPGRKESRSLEAYSASLAQEKIMLSNLDNKLNVAVGVKALILCTEEGYDRSGNLGGMLLHQADIANMSSSYVTFLDANKRIYLEKYPKDTAYEHWDEWVKGTVGLLEKTAPEVHDELRALGVRHASESARAVELNAALFAIERAPFANEAPKV